MTIVVLLLAFALVYFVRDLSRLHRFEWVKHATAFCNRHCRQLPGWDGITGFLFYLLLPLLITALIAMLAHQLLGTLGGFLLAVAVLVYTFGPHDLDTDIDAIIHADSDVDQAAAMRALLGDCPSDDDDCMALAIEGVFRESLQRWFGTIFWFAVLGIYGAILYRMADRITEPDLDLPTGQRALLMRLRQVLDWPVAQLMTLALAIATDFDSVLKAWRQYHQEQGHGLFDGNNDFLYAAARQIVLSGQAARDGYADQITGPMACLRQAMDLVWRMLGVWLTVLALLLLIDLLA
ncbi:MAG: cobalamin biosynthesis protein [Xanthomonadales bacterium]|nr:cobalamin biosynthesis protein [Xanthomonadales bacterium]